MEWRLANSRSQIFYVTIYLCNQIAKHFLIFLTNVKDFAIYVEGILKSWTGNNLNSYRSVTCSKVWWN